MIAKIKRSLDRRRAARQALKPADGNSEVQVTNKTIAAHREEVLGSARKYIYPLQYSKHRVVKASIGIFIIAIIGFFVFCGLELYKFQSTSSFTYAVARVLPFPVAIVGRSLVSYDSYLFELRRYMHYYHTQQNVDFTSASGKQQLTTFKQRSLDQAVQEAYVKQLASSNHVSVSDQEVDTEIAFVRSQNRLGASDQVFANVLSEFWGWSVDDFKREMSQELLAQKVVAKLDTGTNARANQALAQLQQGADFAALAKQDSDDTTTRASGGDYGILIDKSNIDLPPQVVSELFQLKPGQYSGIINTGYSLEIVKVLDVQGNQLHAAHISFNFKPITTYTAPLEAKDKPHYLIHV